MLISPRIGRILSAAGAVLLVVALFLVWYGIARSPAQGSTTSTGWETFPRLRLVLLGGAVLTMVTALVAQRRLVLVARTILGLALAALIVRRIVSPPDIDFPVSSQLGVFVGLAGALAVALGGLVDSTRTVVAMLPDLVGGGPSARQLPPGGGGHGEPVRVPNLAPREHD